MIRLMYLIILTLLTSATLLSSQDDTAQLTPADIENLQFTPIEETGDSDEAEQLQFIYLLTL